MFSSSTIGENCVKFVPQFVVLCSVGSIHFVSPNSFGNASSNGSFLAFMHRCRLAGEKSPSSSELKLSMTGERGGCFDFFLDCARSAARNADKSNDSLLGFGNQMVARGIDMATLKN